MTWVGMLRSEARRMRSECVVALHASSAYIQDEIQTPSHPSGSPTTRNATSTLSASRRMSSDSSSTVSRVAVMTSRP